VYVDGELHVTLRGDTIVPEFLAILEEYVERRYGGVALTGEAIA
jgi:(E)-4-hydroxy-3-methylbut-2-enyl-diphosphate synthase